MIIIKIAFSEKKLLYDFQFMFVETEYYEDAINDVLNSLDFTNVDTADNEATTFDKSNIKQHMTPDYSHQSNGGDSYSSGEYNTSNSHICEVAGCGKKGIYTITGLDGETEYYCYDHYKEMTDILINMAQDVYGNDENASETYDNNSYSNNSNSHSYSYSSDDGYGYDRNDPYYKKNDLDGDGKLTDEEWSNALNDFVNDIEKSGVLEENNH